MCRNASATLVQSRRDKLNTVVCVIGAVDGADDYGGFEESTTAASPTQASTGESDAQPAASASEGTADTQQAEPSVPSFPAPPGTAGSLSYSAKLPEAAAAKTPAATSDSPQAPPSNVSGGAPDTPPAAEPVSSPRPRALGADEKVVAGLMDEIADGSDSVQTIAAQQLR